MEKYRTDTTASLGVSVYSHERGIVSSLRMAITGVIMWLMLVKSTPTKSL